MHKLKHIFRRFQNTDAANLDASKATLEVADLAVNATFYDQESLGKGKIRLLLIYPGGLSDPVQCALQAYDLDSAPAYEALSYSWGEQHRPRQLIVNDIPGFVVSEHLYAALLRLRDKHEPYHIWIDALCISQANDEEKSLQVSQMGLIYRHSRRTVIWLGESDSEARTCRRRHHGVCTDAGLISLEHGNVEQELRQRLEAAEGLSQSEGPWYMKVWWKRLWVVQEFALSPSLPLVMIGPHTISWEFFSALKWPEGNTSIFPILQSKKSGSMLELLALTLRSFACADPRDRVYALLAMVDDPALPITVDYRKSAEWVSAEVMKYIIHKEQSLEFLLDDHDRSTPTALPSWIPEFLEQQSSHVNYTSSARSPQCELLDYHRDIAHSSPGNPSPCGCKTSACLQVRGVRFDSIETVQYPEKLLPQAHPRERFAQRKDLVRRRRASHDMYGVYLGNSLLRALDYKKADKMAKAIQLPFNVVPRLLKNLGLDTTRPLPPALEDLDRHVCMGLLFLDHIFHGSVSLTAAFNESQGANRAQLDLMTTRAKTAAKTAHLKTTPAFIADLAVAYMWEEIVLFKIRCATCVQRFEAPYYWVEGLRERNPIITHVPFAGHNRRFLKTTHQFVGLGAPGAEPGDLIIVPFGASRPWLVRSHGDHYVLVGEVVIPGIMSGQMDDLVRTGQLLAEDFVIR